MCSILWVRSVNKLTKTMMICGSLALSPSAISGNFDTEEVVRFWCDLYNSDTGIFTNDHTTTNNHPKFKFQASDEAPDAGYELIKLDTGELIDSGSLYVDYISKETIKELPLLVDGKYELKYWGDNTQPTRHFEFIIDTVIDLEPPRMYSNGPDMIVEGITEPNALVSVDYFLGSFGSIDVTHSESQGRSITSNEFGEWKVTMPFQPTHDDQVEQIIKVKVIDMAGNSSEEYFRSTTY